MQRNGLPNGVREDRGAFGLTTWHDLPECGPDFGIMWAGPGSRLMIGQPTIAGGAVTHIEHPTADGAYMTRDDARRAVCAFLVAGTES